MENGKRSIGKAMAKKFANFFQVDYRIFLSLEFNQMSQMAKIGLKKI